MNPTLNFKRAIYNALARASDSIVRAIVGLTVGVLIARWLAPENYGLLNFVISIGSVLSVICAYGLHSVIIDRLVSDPKGRDLLIPNLIFLRLLLASCVFGIVLAITLLPIITSDTLKALLLIGSISLFPQALETIELEYQACLDTKYIFLIRNFSFLIFSGLRLWVVMAGYDVLVLMAVVTSEVFFCYIAFYLYSRRDKPIRFSNYSKDGVLDLLRLGLPTMLSALIAILYIRGDQIILGFMVSNNELGVYTAAVKLTECWYFIPASVTAACMPILSVIHKESKEKYINTIVKIMTGLVWGSIIFAIGVSVLSDWLVTVLYGHKYAASSNVLAFYVWGSVFFSVGLMNTVWFTISGKTTLHFIVNFYGAVTYVFLVSIAGASYGIQGAACAVVLSQFITTVLLNFVFHDARPLTKILYKSIFPFSLRLA